LPNIPANQLPEGTYLAGATATEYNWLQALEGTIDEAHFGFLHLGHKRPEDYAEGSVMYYTVLDRAPKVVTVDTDTGVLYGDFRPAGPGQTYWRLKQFFFPFIINSGNSRFTAMVPMDDDHTIQMRSARPSSSGRAFDAEHLPNTDGWYGRFQQPLNRVNDFMIDRELQRSGLSYTGIKGHSPRQSITMEDQAMCASMGTIVDRRGEHLSRTDVGVLAVRRRLLEAAMALGNANESAPGADKPDEWRWLGAGEVILPEESGLMEASAELERRPTKDREADMPWGEIDRS
jgi:hypothetical protein